MAKTENKNPESMSNHASMTDHAEKEEIEKPVKTPAPMADTRDFIQFMGNLMRGVVDGSVTPEIAKAATAAGNVILRGMELNLQWTELNGRAPNMAMPLLLDAMPKTDDDTDPKLIE